MYIKVNNFLNFINKLANSGFTHHFTENKQIAIRSQVKKVKSSDILYQLISDKKNDVKELIGEILDKNVVGVNLKSSHVSYLEIKVLTLRSPALKVTFIVPLLPLKIQTPNPIDDIPDLNYKQKQVIYTSMFDEQSIQPNRDLALCMPIFVIKGYDDYLSCVQANKRDMKVYGFERQTCNNFLKQFSLEAVIPRIPIFLSNQNKIRCNVIDGLKCFSSLMEDIIYLYLLSKEKWWEK